MSTVRQAKMADKSKNKYGLRPNKRDMRQAKEESKSDIDASHRYSLFILSNFKTGLRYCKAMGSQNYQNSNIWIQDNHQLSQFNDSLHRINDLVASHKTPSQRSSSSYNTVLYNVLDLIDDFSKLEVGLNTMSLILHNNVLDTSGFNDDYQLKWFKDPKKAKTGLFRGPRAHQNKSKILGAVKPFKTQQNRPTQNVAKKVSNVFLMNKKKSAPLQAKPSKMDVESLQKSNSDMDMNVVSKENQNVNQKMPLSQFHPGSKSGSLNPYTRYPIVGKRQTEYMKYSLSDRGKTHNPFSNLKKYSTSILAEESKICEKVNPFTGSIMYNSGPTQSDWSAQLDIEMA